MDFSLTTEQDEVAALASRLLLKKASADRLREVERADGPHFDRDLWTALSDAGLLGLHLPEACGGAGLGLVETALVLIEAGRRTAPVPAAPHAAAGWLIASCGAPDQQAAWLPGIADGSTTVVPALAEDHGHAPVHPETTATGADGGWVLDGTKTVVTGALVADALLVPAYASGRVGVFLVRTDDPGVTVSAQRTIDGDLAGRVRLDGVRLGADRLLGPTDGQAAQRLAQVTTVLACAEQLGVVEEALALTARYASTREQFERPIGSFQAVSQRLADGYIDTLGARLTLWQAVWRLDEGLPAEVEVATAKLWAADAGHRIAHTTVHVHGGVGIDLDGDAHRYFTAAKRFELQHGGATEQALAIGRALAAREVADSMM